MKMDVWPLTNLCCKFNLGLWFKHTLYCSFNNMLNQRGYSIYIQTHLIERLAGSDNITADTLNAGRKKTLQDREPGRRSAGGIGGDSFQSRTLIIFSFFTLFVYTLLNILTSILGEFLSIQAGHKGLIFRRITVLIR